MFYGSVIHKNVTVDESTTFNGKSYPFAKLSGTSMSSPATAGVVALMLEANPNLWYDEAKEILHTTAREDVRTSDVPETGNTQWGWGKVNAYAAVQRAEEKLAGVRVIETADIVLYPNPANDRLYVSVPTLMEANVFSVDGKLVLSGEVSESNALDISELQSGVYLLRFVDGSLGSLRFMVR